MRREVFRSYVCEASRCLLNSMGGSMELTYWEAVDAARRPRDGRTGDEIAVDVIERLGLEVTAD